MHNPQRQDGKVAERGINLRLLAAAALAASTSVLSAGASAADFNGDGQADVLWRQTSTGAVAIWLMSGGAIQSAPTVSTVPSDWIILGTGDFNGDRKSDIVWRHTPTGSVAVWQMDGSTIQSTPVFSVTNDWAFQGVGDFNGDGKEDMLWRQTSTGAVVMWLVNGGIIDAAPTVGTVPAEWAIQGVGDLNGDGRADIVWRHVPTSAVASWLMNGATIQSTPGYTVPGEWVIQGIGDVNGDGKADLAWLHTPSGTVATWLMNGAAIQSVPTVANVPGDWVLHGISDYNGDTKGDILWRQSTTGAVAVWMMNGGSVASAPAGWTVPADWVVQPPIPAPATPSGLAANPGSTSSVNLSWQDNSANETGFEIERSPNGSTNWTLVGTTAANLATYQDTGLSAATTYYYRVKAKNGGGKSGNSNNANATTAGVAPTAPTGAAASAQSASSITLSWQDTSSNETGFRVERSANGSSGWTEIATVGANVTSYQNTGLTGSTTYYYRVRAYNANGNSTYSNIANATTQSATANITLAWDDNSTTESGFRVERSPNGSSSWTEVGTTGANVTSYQNTGLTRGATYYYRVRAYTATQFSNYSNTLQVNVP